MTHLEGPIVDSLYDMFLLTWHETFKPPLPLIKKPANHDAENNTYEMQSFLDLIEDYPNVLVNKAKSLNDSGRKLPKLNAGESHHDDDIAGEMLRAQSNLTPESGQRLMDLITAHLSKYASCRTKCLVASRCVCSGSKLTGHCSRLRHETET